MGRDVEVDVGVGFWRSGWVFFGGVGFFKGGFEDSFGHGLLVVWLDFCCIMDWVGTFVLLFYL